MSNTITIELCKEDRQRLDELIGFTSWIASVLKSANAPVIMKQEAPAEEPQEAQDAPEEEEAPAPRCLDVIMPQPEPDPNEPKPVTLDMIRQKVTALLADATKKVAVREIVKAYAPNVTGLSACEDKWPEIWAKLTALEV